jgi:hypothetical protein
MARSKPMRWLASVRSDSASAAPMLPNKLCVLLSLRDGLRSGDVFVPGSRRYADPSSFLLTTEQ